MLAVRIISQKIALQLAESSSSTMPIANYSTSIDVAKTYGEIVTILTRVKARAVMSEYSESGQMTHVSFRIQGKGDDIISYRLPANVDGVLYAMQQDKKVPNSNCTFDQAERTAWRILKDWIRAQMAIYEAGIASMEQLFLPHMQTDNGSTVYERYQANPQILLESKNG